MVSCDPSIICSCKLQPINNRQIFTCTGDWNGQNHLHKIYSVKSKLLGYAKMIGPAYTILQYICTCMYSIYIYLYVLYNYILVWMVFRGIKP